LVNKFASKEKSADETVNRVYDLCKGLWHGVTWTDWKAQPTLKLVDRISRAVQNIFDSFKAFTNCPSIVL